MGMVGALAIEAVVAMGEAVVAMGVAVAVAAASEAGARVRSAAGEGAENTMVA